MHPLGPWGVLANLGILSKHSIVVDGESDKEIVGMKGEWIVQRALEVSVIVNYKDPGSSILVTTLGMQLLALSVTTSPRANFLDSRYPVIERTWAYSCWAL